MKKVSDLLKEERIAKGFSLEDVEKATKIKKEFLTAIEDGQFHTLPSEAYALGFVKNYAHFLTLPLYRVTALFRREYKTEHIPVVPEFRKTQNRFNKRIFSNSKFLLAFPAVLIIAGFIIFQFGPLFFGPKLIVNSPKNGEVINGTVVEVSGKSDPDASVVINDDEVSVVLTGSFRKSLYVFSGDQKITVTAKNRFGKQTQKVINIKVR